MSNVYETRPQGMASKGQQSCGERGLRTSQSTPVYAPEASIISHKISSANISVKNLLLISRLCSGPRWSDASRFFAQCTKKTPALPVSITRSEVECLCSGLEEWDEQGPGPWVAGRGL